MTTSRLPPWVKSNAESVAAEAEPYIHQSDAERAADLVAVCEAGTMLLRAHPDVDAVLKHEDPLPESSRRIFERLRAQARRGGR